ncbi:MAG: biotin transporter BioY [Ignavibacteriae bacterium]|nr:biotin transporter BioY [Ignavibacteriota bacterium]NOG98683.1 biotin transporter BioY [Ignavibacteriota bacterium]
MLRENVSNNKLAKAFSQVYNTQLFWIASFALLMVFAGQLAVPVKPVPFTLQTMIVVLSGAFLGARNGMLSQILYLAMGTVGIPVFAGFSFGPAALFGFTGGYLLAFPIAAFAVGYLVEKSDKLGNVILAMSLGVLIILFMGASYLSLFFDGNISSALFSGAIIFSLWDLIKIAAAVSIYKTVSKKYPKLPY